ncbi:TPA: ATP-binding protein, partial [Staphylococcus aureus]|nr:ATP-binding protein [Staphylococcus aureus]
IIKEQADLFYQLMSLRYEWKSTIITTNIPFSSWGESYRLKDYKTEKSLNIRQS